MTIVHHLLYCLVQISKLSSHLNWSKSIALWSLRQCIHSFIHSFIGTLEHFGVEQIETKHHPTSVSQDSTLGSFHHSEDLELCMSKLLLLVLRCLSMDLERSSALCLSYTFYHWILRTNIWWPELQRALMLRLSTWILRHMPSPVQSSSNRFQSEVKCSSNPVSKSGFKLEFRYKFRCSTIKIVISVSNN